MFPILVAVRHEPVQGERERLSKPGSEPGSESEPEPESEPMSTAAHGTTQPSTITMRPRVYIIPLYSIPARPVDGRYRGRPYIQMHTLT